MSELSDTISGLAVLANAIAAFGALWAARGAYNAAKATKDAAEAELVRNFLNEYFAPEMSSNLRAIAHWKKNNGDSFADEWIKRLSKGDVEAKNVDLARRAVKRYFEVATRLYNNGLIRPEAYKVICNVSGNIIFYDIIDPLELALNPERDAINLKIMMDCVGRYRQSEKIRSVPPT